MKSVRPYCVIIDIGTNDLAARVQPLSVAVKVVDFANELLHDFLHFNLRFSKKKLVHSSSLSGTGLN